MKDKEKLKKILLVLFMFLLLIFVCLICYIIIWDKNHPKEKYLSPDSIQIVYMNEEIYDLKNDISKLKRVKENQEFSLIKEDLEYKVIINESGDLNIINNNEIVNLKCKDEYISEKIIYSYKYLNDVYLLTKEFNLYKIVNKNIDQEGAIEIEKIDLDDEIINIIDSNETNIKGLYVETKSGDIINIDNGNLYNGVNEVFETENGNLIRFDDNSLGFNENTKIVKDGEPVRFSFILDNVVIDNSSIIYNVDFKNLKISTSKMGQMTKIAYYKEKDNTYSINLKTTTGIYQLKAKTFKNF